MIGIRIDGKIESECMAFDHVFEVNGNEELCHHTGYEVHFVGEPEDIWWYEFVDSNGELHYGN